MKSATQLITALIVLVATCFSQAQPAKKELQKRYQFDVSTSLEARVKPASATVLQLFRDAGMSPTEHQLSDEERNKVAAAFAALPPLHQQILKNRLRSINFLDNMPNTALTSTINPGEAYKVFDITFRAEILQQDVSEWLTQKELTCFDTTGSKLTVSIQAGKLSAFQYVLLHEATHVVDGSLLITPGYVVSNGKPLPDSLVTNFINGVWEQHTTAVEKSPLLDGIMFRRGGKRVPVEQAKMVYQALQQSPFVSLYGRSSWHEDLAEYVTVYHFTQKLKQPFTIRIRNEKQELFSYEPMLSPLVRKRFELMNRFYKS